MSNPPTTIARHLNSSIRIDNRGNRHARRSKARFYLSADKAHNGADISIGSVAIHALSAGQHETRAATLTVPAGTKPGTYFVVACADATHKVMETHEKNNCHASKSAGQIPCITGDNDCDGYLPPADCNDTDATIHPGAADLPDMAFLDSNCDGIDGDSTHAIFVATTGNDQFQGDEQHPLLTIAAALARAEAQNKDVYIAAGTYPELLQPVDGVGVYGGYDASWQRALTNASTITGAVDLRGDTAAAFASDIADPTTLQLLTLDPAVPSEPGASSYGLRGADSGGLRLDHLTISAQAGVAGAPGETFPAGIDGQAGAPGNANGIDGAAGTGGHKVGAGGHGGNGGTGGYKSSGTDGDPGLPTTPDSYGRAGGPGGQGGAGVTVDEPGSPGYAGDSGVPGADGIGGLAGNRAAPSQHGFWISGFGSPGLNGTPGAGGGGGGGGGSDDPGVGENIGGGGGGGGQGGGAGEGGGAGQGGGGSLGIFLVNSSGAVVSACTVAAGSGGAGGKGALGSVGGNGGAVGQGGERIGDGSHSSSGADGGLGGGGGRGGDGGGGAGGPSIAIFGLTAADAPGTTESHGNGGAGGAGGRGAASGKGADGPAADFGP